MKTIMAIVAVIGIVLGDSLAAPRVQNQSVCVYLADYALVVRALAIDGSVSTEQADGVLRRIYVIADPTIQEVEGLLRAHGRLERVRNAQQYSAAFLESFIRHGGRLDAFFGSSV